MSSFFFEFLIQPTLVGVYVLAKNVLYDHYLPQNPHVLIDVATNVFAKLVSGFVTVEFLVQFSPMATWAEPFIHGAINGGIKHQFINTDNLSALSLVSSGVSLANGGSRRTLPKVETYTFENGFLEGLSYNFASKITTLPIEGLFGEA